MISREHVERILRLNGVDPSASDEEIKSVLISAKWHDDDAELGVMVLRENKVTHKERVDTLHKVFTSDERLKPETISSLLGIDVDMNSKELETLRVRKRQISLGQMLTIASLAMVIAFGSLFVYMWQHHVDLTYLF